MHCLALEQTTAADLTVKTGLYKNQQQKHVYTKTNKNMFIPAEIISESFTYWKQSHNSTWKHCVDS